MSRCEASTLQSPRMVKKTAASGASHGRAGGRIGAAKRLRNTLNHAPRVRVVGQAARSPATISKATALQAAASSAAASAAADALNHLSSQLNLSAEMQSLAQLVTAAVVPAAVGANSAAMAEAVPTSHAVGKRALDFTSNSKIPSRATKTAMKQTAGRKPAPKEPTLPSVKPASGGTSSSSSTSSLTAAPRGSLVVVQPSATYILLDILMHVPHRSIYYALRIVSADLDS